MCRCTRSLGCTGVSAVIVKAAVSHHSGDVQSGLAETACCLSLPALLCLPCILHQSDHISGRAENRYPPLPNNLGAVGEPHCQTLREAAGGSVELTLWQQQPGWIEHNVYYRKRQWGTFDKAADYI